VLKRIAELYEIEAEIRGKSANQRRGVRQEKTRPLATACVNGPNLRQEKSWKGGRM
jgi:hypothetical protein